jgi:hypothetical protein
MIQLIAREQVESSEFI